MAGALGGFASLLICHPLDTVRTRLQGSIVSDIVSGSSKSKNTLEFKRSLSFPKYSGAWDCFRSTIRAEGVRGLYAGLAGPLAAQGVYKAVMFASYGFASRTLADNRDNISSKVLCGSFAGFVNSFVVCPVELVRNRLMLQKYDGASERMYRGPYDVARRVLQGDGIGGMWRGILPTIARDVPGVGAWFGTFHHLKSIGCHVMLAGGGAGVAFWLVALPFDALKSLFQTQNIPCTPTNLARVVQSAGVASLYRGLGVSVLRGFPSSATVFAVQGAAKDYMESRRCA